MVKWRGEEVKTEIVSNFLELWLPVPRGIRFAVKLVKIAPVPERSPTNAEIFLVCVYCERIRGISLKLHGIGVTSLGSMHKSYRFIKTQVVVSRYLGVGG